MATRKTDEELALVHHQRWLKVQASIRDKARKAQEERWAQWGMELDALGYKTLTEAQRQRAFKQGLTLVTKGQDAQADAAEETPGPEAESEEEAAD